MLNQNQRLRKSFMTMINLKFRLNNRRGQRAGLAKQQPQQNGLQNYPIIVNPDNPYTVPSAQQLMAYPRYDTLPTISFFGNYPYQYYQPYPQHPEEPTFILVSPKSKNKKNPKSKATSTRPPPIKLTDGRQQRRPEQAPKMDIKLVKAKQQANSKFVIEKFVFVPGKRIAELSTSNLVPVKSPISHQTIVKTPKINLQQTVKSQKHELQKQIFEQELELETATVKVESVGMSSVDQPIPDYSGFFPRSVFSQSGNGDEATLILEPNAKAVSGNDGTSISAPISRAILRKGTAVKVLFRPQSFAITGANGIAHAQADLILDFV